MQIKPKNLSSKRKRVRLFTVLYLSSLVTFASPLVPTHSPRIDKSSAETLPEPREYARLVAQAEYGWNDKQFSCLSKLWGKESAWNHLADNPTSTAFGIAQMLGEESKVPEVQIRNGLRYIQHRYEKPCNAWAFWLENKWY